LEKQYAWQNDVLRIEKTTGESETGFNFTQAHILCITTLENMLNK